MLIALVAIVVVIYLSYLFSKYVATGASRVNVAKYIKVVDRIALGQDKMILITCIGERHYLIGVTSQSIQILKELNKEDLIDWKNSAESTGFTAASFKTTLQSMLKKDKDNHSL